MARRKIERNHAGARGRRRMEREEEETREDDNGLDHDRTNRDGLDHDREDRAHSIISVSTASLADERREKGRKGRSSIPSSDIDAFDGPSLPARDSNHHHGFTYEDSDDDDDEVREEGRRRGVWSGVTPGETSAVAVAVEDGDDDDDETQWDEVKKSLSGASLDVMRQQGLGGEGDDGADDLEITIAKGERAEPVRKTLGPSRMDRVIRLVLHMSHTLCLMAAAKAQNTLVNDRLLQARILSLVPERIIDALSRCTPRYIPEQRARARSFEQVLLTLTSWWQGNYHVVGKGVTSHRYEDLEKYHSAKDPTQAFVDDMIAIDSAVGDRIHSARSLAKRLLRMSGSRDTSALLFTSLCRALGLPARLVVSLQPVSWQASKKAGPAPKGKEDGGKSAESAVATASDDVTSDGSDVEMEQVVVGQDGRLNSIKAEPRPQPGQVITPKVNLRKPRPAKRAKSRSVSVEVQHEPIGTAPPIYWTEIFSRTEQKWISIDPIRRKIYCKSEMEPRPNDTENLMTYVVAFEDNGYARDVTRRYTKTFGTRTVRLRFPTRKDYPDWWGRVCATFERPYKVDRDQIEDAELQANEVNEAMPTSLSGFKNHPVYAIEKQLRREEIVHPRTEIGKFRGESVFPRRNVITTKAPENWMKEGRVVKDREHPLKWVKTRSVTINRRREQELRRENNEEPERQGLYAEFQTKLYVAPPVVDGKVPRNAFGNLDMYVPSMLPQGGSHLPHKGIAKIARKLGVDFAEAVTGFEFKQRRAIPVATGIVVPSESASAVLEAYWVSEEAAAEKAVTKRQERAIKRWKKLIIGLRIRERLMSNYGDAGPSAELQEGESELTTSFHASRQDGAAAGTSAPGGFIMDEAEAAPGGFMRDDHDDDSGSRRLEPGGFVPEEEAPPTRPSPRPARPAKRSRTAPRKEPVEPPIAARRSTRASAAKAVTRYKDYIDDDEKDDVSSEDSQESHYESEADD